MQLAIRGSWTLPASRPCPTGTAAGNQAQRECSAAPQKTALLASENNNQRLGEIEYHLQITATG